VTKSASNLPGSSKAPSTIGGELEVEARRAREASKALNATAPAASTLLAEPPLDTAEVETKDHLRT